MSSYLSAALHAPDDGESYSAAWDLAHSRFASEDADRSARLMELIKRDIAHERARQAHLGGRPRTNPNECVVCGRKVYAKAKCQAHYRAERRAM